ncbi:hypothetical protein EXS72_02170 [Candidatus Pacearchaeota archaeon]|nr:hypothetical protein [Candidatus Pacearchaeota archaeon]
MELEEIIKLGTRDISGNQIKQAFDKDQSVNAVAKFIQLEGREKDERLVPILNASFDMPPARQRAYLEQTVKQYAGELSSAVTSNLPLAIGGISDKRVLAEYLLDSPIEPRKFEGANEEWLKSYAGAYSAHELLKNPEKLGKHVESYVTNQIESLKKDGLSKGILEAVAWFYNAHPDYAEVKAKNDLIKIMKNFSDSLDFSEGQKYISGIYATLKPADQSAEAYRIGQAVTKSHLIAKKDKP